MNGLWKIIIVILLSSVKFVAGPPFAYYDKHYGFTFFETVGYCVAGGMLGVLVFSFFSQPIFGAWRWIVMNFKKLYKKEEMFSEPVADVEGNVEITYSYVSKSYKPKLFTPSNRKIVKFWQRYGLIGIAFITPIFLSIPIGTVIASSLAQNRKKVLVYMFFSILFWSVFMTSMFEVFHAGSVQELQHQIQK